MLRSLPRSSTPSVSPSRIQSLRADDAPYTDFSEFTASSEEIAWLRETCPFFTDSYLSYLSKFRFKPEQVHVQFISTSGDGTRGQLEITATGLWVETILWEVPLMACLSEIYFRTADQDWSYEGQEGRYLPVYMLSFAHKSTSIRGHIREGESHAPTWNLLQ